HAATDFDMPTYADDGHEQYAHSSSASSGRPIADEISDQRLTYNVHGAYNNNHNRNQRMSLAAAYQAELDEVEEQAAHRIPRHEQDEDLWRHGELPGRDPVTGVRRVGDDL